MIILKILEKLCHVNFFKIDKKNVNYKKTEEITISVFKKARRDVFGFLMIHIFKESALG